MNVLQINRFFKSAAVDDLHPQLPFSLGSEVFLAGRFGL